MTQGAGDKTEFSVRDEEGNRQTLTLYGDKREGLLDLTSDSITFYKQKYSQTPLFDSI